MFLAGRLLPNLRKGFSKESPMHIIHRDQIEPLVADHGEIIRVDL